MKNNLSRVPLLAFVSPLLVSMAVYADDYLLDPAPVYYQGTAHVETPYEKPTDSGVCELYLENLRYFAKQNIPMSCDRPIAPHLKKKIHDVAWENLDPARYPDLFNAVVAATFPPSGGGVKRWSEEVKKGVAVFRRAKLQLKGYPTFMGTSGVGTSPPPRPIAFNIVQFGINHNDPNSPDPVWRCYPIRGKKEGHEPTDLRFFIVTEDLTKMYDQLRDINTGHTGDYIKIINTHPYVESSYTDTANIQEIQLSEIQTKFPVHLEPVCLYRFDFIDKGR
ncbi:MAG TPA: hypothetical protein VMH34_06760 [Gammaproteobacteria bacterium]|nr:hypothetical protein [Gammaproteobacteria bacterium]